MPLRPAVFDCDILSLDIARFAQSLVEGGHNRSKRVGRGTAEVTDDRHRLLCAYGQWPTGSYAAEQAEEIAALHPIISSVRVVIRT